MENPHTKKIYRGHTNKSTLKVRSLRQINASKQALNQSQTKPKARRTTTAIFVPWSPGGELFELISESENKCSESSDWNVKIQEKSGTPIINMLATKFPIISGCPKEDYCKVCENGNGVGCSGKNIVY